MKALFYGASAASMAGILFGLALKTPIAPTSSYGQQLQISQPSQRAPSAMDAWTPTEGAPPAYFADAAVPSGDDIEKALARLTVFDRNEPLGPAEPVRTAQAVIPPAPQPYLPSRRGDILAPPSYSQAAYEVAANDLPGPEPVRRSWRGDEQGYEPEPVYEAPRYARYDERYEADYPLEDLPYDRGYR